MTPRNLFGLHRITHCCHLVTKERRKNMYGRGRGGRSPGRGGGRGRGFGRGRDEGPPAEIVGEYKYFKRIFSVRSFCISNRNYYALNRGWASLA